jgi:aarF domain-containing kinase
MKNGGIYIKLGQHIGMLDYLLPEQYVFTMRAHLLDRCPVSSWESVRQTILEDLGAPPEVIFSEFEHTPIASASLAQVHLARDALTGKRVAVKVQHRGLRETSDVDIATIEFVVKAVKRFAGVDYLWLVEEVQENLPAELDFLIEAANSERCAINLSSARCSKHVRGNVAVPVIDHLKTSHRVVTMEYIDGVKVTDIDGLKKLGAPPAAVASLISQTFNEMIFKFGDIHADPHAANMLVRKTPDGKTPDGQSKSSRTKQQWQLVLLDHGLYRLLDDDFRLEYASLWRSLIFGDVAGITKSAKAMNAGDAVPLFAGTLTRRPWREVSQSRRGGADRLKLSGTPEEKEEIMEYSVKYAGEIGELLARIPRELLLLLKTNDNLRAVDVELGAGVNTYLITARECTKALAEHRAAQMPGWRSFAASWVESIRLESRLLALKTMSVVEPLRAALFGKDVVVEDEDF